MPFGTADQGRTAFDDELSGRFIHQILYLKRIREKLETLEKWALVSVAMEELEKEIAKKHKKALAICAQMVYTHRRTKPV